MDALAEKWGVNRTAVIEMAVRSLAEREGVTVAAPVAATKKELTAEFRKATVK